MPKQLPTNNKSHYEIRKFEPQPWERTQEEIRRQEIFGRQNITYISPPAQKYVTTRWRWGELEVIRVFRNRRCWITQRRKWVAKTTNTENKYKNRRKTDFFRIQQPRTQVENVLNICNELSYYEFKWQNLGSEVNYSPCSLINELKLFRLY